MLYRKVELKEGALVQFVGVYALKWDYSQGLPECGFVEFEGDYDQLLEQHEALQELLAVRDAEVKELRARIKKLEGEVPARTFDVEDY